MKLFQLLPNSEIFSNISPENFDSKYEAELLLRTLNHVEEFEPDFFKTFSVVILLNNGVKIEKWDVVPPNDKRVIFIIFDELGRLPIELLEDSSNIVFHAHLSFEDGKQKYSNLFHYPLGCNSFVPDKSYVPPSARRINVFFSGNLHAGRKKLYRALTRLPLPLSILTRLQKFLKIIFDNKFPSSYIRFTEGFGKGFSTAEYSDYLVNSKIIISPPGISNLECFRHYEGLRAGCVVIAEKLPVKPQYKGSPVIEVGNWSNGFALIHELLQNHERLDALSWESYLWYRDRLSPKPIAKYILDKIQINS